MNEEKFFEDALIACHGQKLDGLSLEIVLVDSGSTDRTLDIAKAYDCKIVHIPKSKFSFGRSLNWGCAAASGKYLALISAHCIPTHDRWLIELIAPLVDETSQYSYGRQIGNQYNKFSEKQLFAKYFPDFDKNPQEGFFVNNANSALLRSVWEKHKFDEHVTGLEDMVLGKLITRTGGKISYISSASVTHIHEETYSQVKRRYYREALTLREVMPEVTMGFIDFLHFSAVGILNDLWAAWKERELLKRFPEIVMFRIMQFWGSYKGQNENRKLSRAQKENYYYPRVKKTRQAYREPEANSTILKQPSE